MTVANIGPSGRLSTWEKEHLNSIASPSGKCQYTSWETGRFRSTRQPQQPVSHVDCQSVCHSLCQVQHIKGSNKLPILRRPEERMDQSFSQLGGNKSLRCPGSTREYLRNVPVLSLAGLSPAQPTTTSPWLDAGVYHDPIWQRPDDIQHTTNIISWFRLTPTVLFLKLHSCSPNPSGSCLSIWPLSLALLCEASEGRQSTDVGLANPSWIHRSDSCEIHRGVPHHQTPKSLQQPLPTSMLKIQWGTQQQVSDHSDTDNTCKHYFCCSHTIAINMCRTPNQLTHSYAKILQLHHHDRHHSHQYIGHTSQLNRWTIGQNCQDSGLKKRLVIGWAREPALPLLVHVAL